MNKPKSLALITFLSILGSTSAGLQFGPGPVVIPFKLRVFNPDTSEIAAPFLTCSGRISRNASLAGSYYHFIIPPSAGELRCGSADNQLIGAPADSSSAVFTGYQAPGSINTAFSVVNNTLQWKNSDFDGSNARFYQVDDEGVCKVYGDFHGSPGVKYDSVTLVVQSPDTKE